MKHLYATILTTRLLITALLTGTVGLMAALGPVSAAEPIKLGFVGGISGPCAPLIDSELKGLQLALDEFNAAGGADGRQVVLVTKDGKTDPAESAKAARELVLNEKVDILTGPCSSAVLLAVSSVSREEQVPFYSVIAGTTRASIDFGHRYLYLIGDNSYSEPRAVAEYVAQRPWTKVATIGLDYEWGHQVVEEFLAHLKDLKPEITVTRQLWPQLGETNFASIIPPALADEPDLIFAVTFGSATTNLIQQGKGYGMFERTELLTFMPLDTLKAMGDEMPEGVYGFLRAPFYALPGKGVEEFVSKYRERYGDYPDDWAVLGYDGFMQVFEATRHAGTVENEALREALTTRTYSGLRGELIVREIDGQNSSPTFLGKTAHTEEYPFPILENVVSVRGESLMPDPELVEERREKQGSD